MGHRHAAVRWASASACACAGAHLQFLVQRRQAHAVLRLAKQLVKGDGRRQARDGRAAAVEVAHRLRGDGRGVVRGLVEGGARREGVHGGRGETAAAHAWPVTARSRLAHARRGCVCPGVRLRVHTLTGWYSELWMKSRSSMGPPPAPPVGRPLVLAAPAALLVARPRGAAAAAASAAGSRWAPGQQGWALSQAPAPRWVPCTACAAPGGCSMRTPRRSAAGIRPIRAIKQHRMRLS